MSRFDLERAREEADEKKGRAERARQEYGVQVIMVVILVRVVRMVVMMLVMMVVMVVMMVVRMVVMMVVMVVMMAVVAIELDKSTASRLVFLCCTG